MIALLKCKTVAYFHMYGKSDRDQVVTFGTQLSQHLTFKQPQWDDDYRFVQLNFTTKFFKDYVTCCCDVILFEIC